MTSIVVLETHYSCCLTCQVLAAARRRDLGGAAAVCGAQAALQRGGQVLLHLIILHQSTSFAYPSHNAHTTSMQSQDPHATDIVSLVLRKVPGDGGRVLRRPGGAVAAEQRGDHLGVLAALRHLQLRPDVWQLVRIILLPSPALP